MADAAGEIPHYFTCPISLDIMWDPVTVSTGHTFDRPSIDAWLSTGNSTCPITRSTISSDLIPNLTLRRHIHHWRFSHHPSSSPTTIPTPKSPASTDPSFLSRSSSASGLRTPARVAALAHLSRLVRVSEENRSPLSSIPETRRVLKSILFSAESDSDELRNESLALLATLQLNETDSNSAASDTDRIGLLVGLMLEPNMIHVRANAAAVIEAVLAGITSPELRSRIAGAEGAIEAVVAVIRDGAFYRRAMKVGVKALFGLCLAKQNRLRAVAAGAVEVLMDLVTNSADLERGDVERALATAELLCRAPDGCAAFAASPLTAGALVRTLLMVSERATEHAAGLLLAVCTASERARGEAVVAGVVTRLLLVVQGGCTERGKRKALMLLRLLQESWPRDSDGNYIWSDVVPC